ncbi:hypothetical protein, partial [Pseudoxanthomonas mexicana]|uniref:hypothetical protein n=1 Tax=Pseudoxanthomonas mexicana TaxID=128785 RepID=UPI00289C79B3
VIAINYGNRMSTKGWPVQYLAFPGMVEHMKSSIRAKYRWEEEGRLLEQWSKAPGSRIGA